MFQNLPLPAAQETHDSSGVTPCIVMKNDGVVYHKMSSFSPERWTKLASGDEWEHYEAAGLGAVPLETQLLIIVNIITIIIICCHLYPSCTWAFGKFPISFHTFSHVSRTVHLTWFD